MTDAARLDLASLGVSIGTRSICDDLTMSVQRGECWAVLGCNGGGKTTLLHTLAGLHAATAGSVQIDGDKLVALSNRERAKRIGVLLQDYDDIYSSTVLDVAIMGCHPHLRAWEFETATDIDNARGVLRALGLSGLENRLLSTLSGGERRRAHIATVLVQNPGVYLLDEPTNHLDIRHQMQVLEIFRRLLRESGASMMMAIHDVNLACRLCSHAILLLGGGKALTGQFNDIVTAENLSLMYGHEIRHIGTNYGNIFVPH